MNSKLYDLLKSFKVELSEVEKNFLEQQKELELTRLERDFYKEKCVNLQNVSECTNVAHLAIYSRDNGEGVDTESCVGVFTNKSNAMQAILEVCKNNKEIDLNGFDIRELKVDRDLKSDGTVYVMQHDEEAHCEISTSIVGVECYISVNGYNNDEVYRDCYSIDYIVNKVYHIEH
jgi:hypothetical protein